MSTDRTPLATVEAQFASWLATLDSTTAPPIAREQAVKHLAAAFMEERLTSTRLAEELVALRTWKAEAQRFERSLASIMIERESPAPQTSAPASPPRLSIVPRTPATPSHAGPQTSAPASPPRLSIVPRTPATPSHAGPLEGA